VTGQPVSELIHDIIDRRLVRAVFQPVVHLPTQQIVGYEALARGPVGSALESPLRCSALRVPSDVCRNWTGRAGPRPRRRRWTGTWTRR